MLDNGRVVRKPTLQGSLGLGRLAHADILDVSPAEDDVLVHLVPGGHGAVSRPVLGAKRSDFGQGDRGHLGVDGVEDAFIPDL